jgi:hypothetical protein
MWNRLVGVGFVAGLVLGSGGVAAQEVAAIRWQSGAAVAERRSPGTNVLTGALVGAASGALFGAVAPESCCVPFDWSRGSTAALWAGIGAGGGALIGVVVGQLGHDPLPPWKAALIGGGLGGAGGALAGAIFYSEGTGYYTAFGAGMGILVGTAVGLLNRDRTASTAMRVGRPVVRPGATGPLVGWQAAF